MKSTREHRRVPTELIDQMLVPGSAPADLDMPFSDDVVRPPSPA
jgi:hypothetical protein